MRAMMNDRIETPTKTAREAPVRLQRQVRATLGHVGAIGVDVSIEPREDGRVAIVMPLQWASLFTENLASQAAAFKEKLLRATWEIQAKEAQLHAVSEAAAQRWEVEQERTYAAYKKLLRKGLSHRQALHKLKERGELWTITMLDEIVTRQEAKERRQRRAAAEARVRQKLGRMPYRIIAEQEGLSRNQVVWITQKVKRGKGR